MLFLFFKPLHILQLYCDNIIPYVELNSRDHVNQSYNDEITELLDRNLFIKAISKINSTGDLSIEVEKKFFYSFFQNSVLFNKQQFNIYLDQCKNIHIKNLPLLCLLHVINKNYRQAIQLAHLIIEKTKNSNDKAKAYFIIGCIYKDIFHETVKARQYFFLGSSLPNSLYSLMCYLLSKKKIQKYTLKSQYHPKSHNHPKDYIFLRLKQLAMAKQDVLFTEYAHSISKKDFEEPSLTLINLLDFLYQLKNKSYLLQIILLCYEKTKIILKDYFTLPHELLEIHMEGKVKVKDIFICFAIMSRESKFYSHKLVSEKGALGGMQIMPKEAKKLCKQLNMKYSGEMIKNNLKFNILICLLHYKMCSKAVNGNKVLSICYYHSGRLALKILKVLQAHFLLNTPLGLVMSLEFISTVRANQYVKSVMEMFILCNLCCNNRKLNIEDLYLIFAKK